MKKQEVKTIHTYPRCFNCKKGKSYIFQKRHQVRQNNSCKCLRHSNIYGYDTDLYQKDDLFYTGIVASGQENAFSKQKVRCSICGQIQPQINKRHGQNVKCINKKCPSIGFDFEIEDNMYCLTASGVITDINNYNLQKERSM